MNSDTQTITINVPNDVLFAFLSDPLHMPQWAGAFCSSVERSGDSWLAQTPLGKVKLACNSNQQSGIIDYEFKPALPIKIMLHSRVIADGSSSQLVLTHYQIPFTPEDFFEKQKKKVSEQLVSLKSFMEKN